MARSMSSPCHNSCLSLPIATFLTFNCTLCVVDSWAHGIVVKETMIRSTLLSYAVHMQVVAMRLPVPIVQQHLKDILDGILLWSGDSKNQFKLKVIHQSLCKYYTMSCYGCFALVSPVYRSYSSSACRYLLLAPVVLLCSIWYFTDHCTSKQSRMYCISCMYQTSCSGF